ncbi:acetate kinase [Methylovirgula ligni]|uniref:Acetate kinase n=1 Tax=Methylovirgula ligni TaxID=569860 RepID=A0A3D9Z0X4_9HYPH|nr:acetate/propionate family kinase [Methylovirgula ligni]QAY95794.1 acetate kinase [Methylovirgula ligni]REF88822.1 acetate kinase [Methylovirgula ligni]
MADAVLTLNAGSSSIKFSLFRLADSENFELFAKGEIEEIESNAPHLFSVDAKGAPLSDRKWDRAAGFDELLGALIERAETHLGQDKLFAIGHRVVHGGPKHYRPERVTPELLDELDKLTPLAPLHEPHSLAPIRAILAARPELPQVACFDTAFHHTVPMVAKRFALPPEYEAEGVRRYGFHGLSYEYIAGRISVLAPHLAAGRVIAAHLGNGASLCAMKAGRSVEMTTGFTALDGLVMGTRCGALDPGVILYMGQQRGLNPKQIEDILYRRSGLLGVSGISSDMRTLEASDDPRAKEAIDLFVYRIVREIGALTSSLGGLDGLIFTAGIGEHSPQIRARVCAGVEWLGVKLDLEANHRNAIHIGDKQSRVAVWAIPTDEEVMIARHTRDTVGAPAPAL